MNVTTTAYQYMNLVDDDYYTDEIQDTDKPELKQNTSSTTTQINSYGTDTLESVPEIEHYNNYNATGNHSGNNAATNGVKTTSNEWCILNNSFLDLSFFFKPGTEVFVSNKYHKMPIQIATLFDKEANRIQAYMIQGIQDFMAGKIDSTEIIKIIENAYHDILAYNISAGRTDGTNPYYNARLLRDVQSEFGRLSVVEADMQNRAEGSIYAKEQFGLTSNDRFVYYNAKFFHLNKELQAINTKAIEQISQKEGFDFFDVHGFLKNSHSWTHCFNSLWEGNAKNLHISQMKNTNLEPPKDFKMFFAPTLISKEAWANATTQLITTRNPLFPSDWHFPVTVPRGMSLFKHEPLWAKQGSHTNQDRQTFITWDVTKHLIINKGDDLDTRLKEFFDKYINNFDKGVLSVWSGGTKSIHDVNFNIMFSSKEMFHGSELSSAVNHNSFISNFELHMFLQW